MSLGDRVRTAVRNFLNISTDNGVSINIHQLMDHDAEVFKDRIWYRGRANEIEELYAHIQDNIGNGHFWGSKPTRGMKIRKIHTGLPSLIVDTLTDVCVGDLYAITVDDPDMGQVWEDIAEENLITDIISDAVRDTLYLGDGAFKLSYDPTVSKLPIIEFYPADRVDFEYNRGRIGAVVFKTKKTIKQKPYLLKERYDYDSITYSLVDVSNDREADISDFPELDGCRDIKNNAHFLPAVPLMFRRSTIYPGRGKSIFDGKLDDFDAFDEVFSQWMLAVRKGQIKEYIPVDLLPRKVRTGEVLESNDFDNEYIQLQGSMAEGVQQEIKTTQGTIQYEALLSTYCTVLDLCLQGIISPSTLGIDVKKLDNAEAQREKEKTTLYTRNRVTDVLNKAIRDLVQASLDFYCTLNGRESKEVEVTVNFGAYANPSFEAQVETIGKAATSGIMSTKTQVDELYGDDKDDDWKAEEVKRIKEERGILEMNEPALNDFE